MYLCGGDAVDERHLLKALIGGGDGYLPTRVHVLVHHFDGVSHFIFLSFHKQFDIVLEALDLEKE